MKRRDFVTLSATTLGALPVMGFSSFERFNFNMPLAKPAWVIELIKLNDKRIEPLTALQVKDASLKSFGGILDTEEIPTPQTTSSFISILACAIASPESAYYKSADLLNKVAGAIQYFLKVQHSDGTIDLLSTNFHSPPDTAFSVEKLAPAYSLLKASKTMLFFCLIRKAE